VVATVDSIFSEVERLLASKRGRELAARQLESIKHTLTKAPEIDLLRRKLMHSRPGAMLGISVSDARSREPISVRIGGSICGRIELAGRGRRWFRPDAKTFGDIWPAGAPDRVEWSDPLVREFVRKAVALRYETGQPEKAVEAELIQQLRGSPKRGHLAAVRRLQPVLLAGCPFQVPLPISASKDPKVARGSVDVLARGDRRFRVIEIKAPNASKREVEHAFDQAVAYCAALDQLLRGPAKSTYLRLLGKRSRAGVKQLRIDAAVAVEQPDRERVEKAARRLNQSNARLRLIGMFYQWEHRRPIGDRLRVANVEVLAEPQL